MTRVPLWDAPVSMGLLVKDCSLLPKCSLSGYGYHGAIGVLEHTDGEEGIAADFFDFEVGEVWRVPLIDHDLQYGDVDTFRQEQDALIAVDPIEEWVVLFSSCEHLLSISSGSLMFPMVP